MGYIASDSKISARSPIEVSTARLWRRTFVRSITTLDLLLAPFQPAADHGGTVDREEQLTRFREDPDCLVLVSNPATLGEGISLHQVCQDALYVDRDFMAGRFLQSLDRIHCVGPAPDARRPTLRRELRSWLHGEQSTRRWHCASDRSLSLWAVFWTISPSGSLEICRKRVGCMDSFRCPSVALASQRCRLICRLTWALCSTDRRNPPQRGLERQAFSRNRGRVRREGGSGGGISRCARGLTNPV